jgi:undecaprenyl-diphosphatase
MITLEAIDQGAAHALKHAHLPALTPLMVGLIYLGSAYVVPVLALLAGGAMAARGLLRPALLLLGTVAAAFGLTYATKAVVNRPPPNLSWGLVKSAEPMAEVSTRSFPSTSALASAALFGSLALLLAHRAGPRLRRWLAVGGFVVPFLVGFACLYAGHNYVSDVLAGWAAGAALALLCGRAERAREGGETHA